MKKIVKGILFLLIFNSSYIKCQNAFYDALTLSRTLDAKKHFGVKHIPLFYKYYPNKNENEIATELNNNPLLNKYFDATSSADLPNFVGATNTISKLGNLDVTNFADALAKFLVERTKQELNQAFFKNFTKSIDSQPELKILFPSTATVLKSVGNEVYNYSYFIQILREAFEEDLSNLVPHLEDFVKDPHYNYIFKNPLLRNILLSALEIINDISSGKHPGEIIQQQGGNLKLDSIDKSGGLRSSLRVFSIFSTSLQSKNSNNYWLSRDSVSLLMKDENTFRIYLGLIYASTDNDILFRKDSKDTLNFKKTLGSLATMFDNYDKYKDTLNMYKNYILSLLDKANKVNVAINSMKNAPANNRKFNDYYQLYDATLNLVEFSLTINKLPKINFTIPKEVNKYLTVARSGGRIAVDVNIKNYSSAILYTTIVLDSLIPDSIDKQKLLKYGTFMASVVQAQNANDIENAISSIALPVGSSSIKRNTLQNWSINAFVGVSAGGEYAYYNKPGKWAWNTGLSAPIGIAWSRGCRATINNDKDKTAKFGKNYKYKDGTKIKALRGSSASLFFSIIDVGAVCQFRLDNDSTPLPQKIKLQNIFAPGVFFVYGIRGIPLSIFGGAQYSPQLRQITVNNNVVDANTFRLNLGLVIDIPLLNLSTKTERKVSK
jgi:hypothetical protein